MKKQRDNNRTKAYLRSTCHSHSEALHRPQDALLGIDSERRGCLPAERSDQLAIVAEFQSAAELPMHGAQAEVERGLRAQRKLWQQSLHRNPELITRLGRKSCAHCVMLLT